MKKIILNILSISNINSGAGTYALNVLKFMPESENIKFTVFADTSFYKNFASKTNLQNKFQWEVFDFSGKIRRIFFEQYRFPLILNSLNPDILHSFSNILPVNFKGRNFLTLHDVMFKMFFKRYPLSKQIYYNYYVSKSIEKADKIFVPTVSTKNDLKKFYYNKNLEAKIQIINYSHNSLLNKNIECDKTKKILSELNLSKKYILFVGTLEPGKNLEFIYKISENINENIDFVIVGNNGWKTKKIKNENIKFFSGIDELYLSALYKSASLLAYPVIYEGVGLPLYEAKFFGIPIISSDYPAAQEIISPENILPLDINLWIKRIKEILLTPNILIKNSTNENHSGWMEHCEKLMCNYSEYPALK